jgi:hypothetical protein
MNFRLTEGETLSNILLWYKKNYNPKDNPQLLGGWMCPRSFSFIVEADTNIGGTISMNYLVFLDPYAGELEKILSGVKCMLVKEFDSARTAGQPISPGDSLYFLRKKGEYILRVKATVVRVLSVTNDLEECLSHILKEMQPKLQLTENQFNRWSVMKQVLLVEFDSARKIEAIQIAQNNVTDGSNWIAFKEFGIETE